MSNKISAFWAVACLTIFFCVQTAPAQSGGAYQITQTVLSTGETSSGGAFSLENTGGQALAGGFLQNSSYSLYMGFWTPPNLAPTAASVSIGGRVITTDGQGIRNAIMTLTDSSGASRTAKTATFGYYRFTDVRAGETYVLAISSKRFIFSSPTRILNIQEELTDVDFIAEEENLRPNF